VNKPFPKDVMGPDRAGIVAVVRVADELPGELPHAAANETTPKAPKTTRARAARAHRRRGRPTRVVGFSKNFVCTGTVA